MSDPAFRCSALARSLDEPLAGTASRIRAWLLVEHPGRWDHDAVRTSLPHGRALHRLADRAGVRVLLIKQRARPTNGVRRCYAAYTGLEERRLVAFTVADPAQLLDLDLRSLAAQRFRGIGDEVEGPLYVVCTHGKHDACCAREGLPVYGALAHREDVWEATHVGGDRFAGNVVCFPDGTYYGWVDPSNARALVDGHDRGELLLEHLRGRSCHPPAVQAADRWLRERLAVTGIDDLPVVSYERTARRHVVTFRTSGGALHPVEVTITRGEPRRLTCKSLDPRSPRAFALSSPA